MIIGFPPYHTMKRARRKDHVGPGTNVSVLTRRLGVATMLLDADGKPRYTVHQLRHTRGTQMVQDGHALHIVQRALGHKDPRSTQLYADVTEDDVRRALETRR